ncbi:MAG: hypothetical protein ABI790_16645, partial [Betaproteobacteria bacterium]
MKTRIRKALGLFTLTMVAAGSGIANGQYYGGLNFDLSRYSSLAHPGGSEADTGFFLANTALDDRRVRYGLKLGYQLSPRIALVSRYSAFDRRDSVSPLARSYGLDLEGNVPVLAGLAISGSAGISRLGSEATYGSGFYSGLFPSPGSRAYTAGRLGLGMAYQFNSSVGLRFDVERYRALRGSSMGELGADHLS